MKKGVLKPLTKKQFYLIKNERGKDYEIYN